MQGVANRIKILIFFLTKINTNSQLSSKKYNYLTQGQISKVHPNREDLESAFDGAHHQQPYTNKMKTRNYAFFEPMTRAKGRNKVELPTIVWEMGLRSY